MAFVKAIVAVLILAAYFAGVFEGHANPGGPNRFVSAAMQILR